MDIVIVSRSKRYPSFYPFKVSDRVTATGYVPRVGEQIAVRGDIYDVVRVTYDFDEQIIRVETI